MQKTERMELRMSRAERNALRLALVSHAREVSGLPIAADRTEADIVRRGLAHALRDLMVNDPARPADPEWAHPADDPQVIVEKYALWLFARDGRHGAELEGEQDADGIFRYRPTGDLQQARDVLHLADFTRGLR